MRAERGASIAWSYSESPPAGVVAGGWAAAGVVAASVGAGAGWVGASGAGAGAGWLCASGAGAGALVAGPEGAAGALSKMLGLLSGSAGAVGAAGAAGAGAAVSTGAAAPASVRLATCFWSAVKLGSYSTAIILGRASDLASAGRGLSFFLHARGIIIARRQAAVIQRFIFNTPLPCGRGHSNSHPPPRGSVCSMFNRRYELIAILGVHVISLGRSGVDLSWPGDSEAVSVAHFTPVR